MHGRASALVSVTTMDEIRCAIEIREDTTRQSPGRLVGVVINYNEKASDRPEIFEDGALTWPAEGVVLNRRHVRGAPIMRITPEVRGSAVVVDQALPDTQAGRDTATEMRSGLFTGLSVEFKAIRQKYEGGLRKIQSATLAAVGLVDAGSYIGSRVELRGKRRRRLWL